MSTRGLEGSGVQGRGPARSRPPRQPANRPPRAQLQRGEDRRTATPRRLPRAQRKLQRYGGPMSGLDQEAAGGGEPASAPAVAGRGRCRPQAAGNTPARQAERRGAAAAGGRDLAGRLANQARTWAGGGRRCAWGRAGRQGWWSVRAGRLGRVAGGLVLQEVGMPREHAAPPASADHLISARGNGEQQRTSLPSPSSE